MGWQQDGDSVVATSGLINRRLNGMFDIAGRKEKLRQCRANATNEDMIRLLIKLRIRVHIRNETEGNLNCCGKIAKLVLDTFSSMGMHSKSAEDWVKNNTTRGHTLQESLGVDMKDLEEIKSNTANGDDDDIDSDGDDEPRPQDTPFDEGDKTWYITYDEALQGLCSETIGPRLPDGFHSFVIEDPYNQMKIDEWFMIKNNCYADWKRYGGKRFLWVLWCNVQCDIFYAFYGAMYLFHGFRH